MTFLQEANLRLEKRLADAGEKIKPTRLPHDKAQNKCDNNAAASENGNDHMSNNNTRSSDDDGRFAPPADNFWGVINRARGLRLDESNIFGDWTKLHT